jgi:glycyl-tRNA synthetase
MKENLRREFKNRFVFNREDIFPIETSILTKQEVLVASGHESGFSDPLVECKKCHERFRADQEIPKAKDHEHELTDEKDFNLMFKTYAGPVEESANLVYLRPETAQGMFTNFKLVADSMRTKIPFGIAQIGKAFRNEITTGNFIFRLREFEQAEIEYFVLPMNAETHFNHWVEEWSEFFTSLGLTGEKVRVRKLEDSERAHYAAQNTDIEYNFPFGWSELAGVANRTDYDLKAHIEDSGRELTWFNEETKEKVIPYVIEPTLGLDRLIMALLVHGYCESDGSDGREKGEVSLKLHPRIAPITAAVFPLVKKDKLPEIAQEVVRKLREANLGFVQYDESGSIGKRYRRHDEIGTPYCITIDFESLEDDSVTVRHRDTLKQERINVSELVEYINNLLKTY